MRRACFTPLPLRGLALLTGLIALACGACSGHGSTGDASAGSDNAGPSGGFVPQVGMTQDAALPAPGAPVVCGEMGLASAQAVAYSPDGGFLAVAGSRFRLLSTSDWHEVRRLDTTSFAADQLDKVAFVAGGTALLGAMTAGPIGFWRVDDGAFLYSLDFPAPASRVHRWQQIATSNTSLLALTDGKTVALWDVDKRAAERSIVPTQGEIAALALSPKADLLALLESEGQAGDADLAVITPQISLWDAKQGRLLRTISSGGASITAIALSPDASVLAMVARDPACQSACDHMVELFRTSDGQPLGRSSLWKGDDLAPTRLGYLPGGGQIAVVYAASSAPYARLLLIRTSDGALVNIIADFSSHLVFSPDGKLVTPGPSIEIRSVTDGTIIDRIPASTGNQAPAFSPDGQFLASADGQDAVLWRLADGQEAQRFTGLGKNLQSLAFSPDGRTLASGGKDGIVRMWGIDQGTAPLVQKQGQPVTSVVFSPDGSTLATGDSLGNIHVRETKTGIATNIWYGQGSVSALAFSPDGRLLVSGGAAPGLRLWEVQTGRTLGYASHGAEVLALAFSPDGARLASAAASADCGKFCTQEDGDSAIVIWRVIDSSLVLESTIATVPRDLPPAGDAYVPAHAAVWGLAFAPDGKTLLTAGPQNAGRIYQLPEGDVLASFGSFLARTPFAVSPDATRIVIGASPIRIWCAAGATGN